MPFYENQPTIYPLHRLLEELLAGEIHVPRFQRPGTESTWKPQQRRDLLDSIYRGFPVGTILLWSTNEGIHTLPIVGGAQIPDADSNRKRRLVLDGHQRLSTLIAILGPALDEYVPAKSDVIALRETWVFDADGDDEQGGEGDTRFRLLRSDERPGSKQVPLSIALDRVKLNEWVRVHKKLTKDEVRRVDSLRDRLREFSVPVATLVADSLGEATETFKRVNSSGTPMSDFHMVTALAYTNEFDPQAHFEWVRSALLEPEGWGDFDDGDVLRVCAGLVRRGGNMSQHPAKIDVARLGQALREDPTLIKRAGNSLAAATVILRNAVGVHGPEALPYTWQLIVLAIELGARGVLTLRPKEDSQCARWFWLTTYGGVFAGVNSSIVDRASRALTEMLDGKDERAMHPDVGRKVEEPGRFDFRAARARACLLAMARFVDNGKFGGSAHRALAVGAKSVQTLSPKVGRSAWYNLVIVSAHEEIRGYRDALRHQASGESQASDLKRLAHLPIKKTDSGDIQELLQIRRARLLETEKKFVEELGLEWRELISR